MGCNGADTRVASALRVAIDTTRGLDSVTVIASGFSSGEIRGLRRRAPHDEVLANGFRVSVAGSDSVAVSGRYSITDSTVVFRPLFPFDAAREYTVLIDADRLIGRKDSSVRSRFALPSLGLSPSTTVLRLYPSANAMPENQLRIYIEFSAPMSRDGGLDFVQLVDDAGKEVAAAFLPLDGDFWNSDRTRYTMFLDPGRVKRGIRPNQQMGRAFIAGRRYSIRIDDKWRDGRGQPLASRFTKVFRAAPADFRPIALADWRIAAPRAGTRIPLVVRFPEPLDHGLLRRALGVIDGQGSAVDGEIEVPRGEREWRFIPARAWVAGTHQVLVLDILEDLAGNRVNRPFEVDLFTHTDSSSAPSRFTVPFVIR